MLGMLGIHQVAKINGRKAYSLTIFLIIVVVLYYLESIYGVIHVVD